MPNLYASVTDLRIRFSIPDNFEDAQLDQALNSASRGIDQFCRRVFFTSNATVTLIACDTHWLRPADTDLWVGDIVSVTSLATDTTGDGVYETVWAPTDYQLWPVNATAGPEPRPFSEIRAVGTLGFPVPSRGAQRLNLVQVTGVFGWPTAPPSAIKEACLIVAAELFKLKDAPFGVAGFDQWGAVRVRDNPKAEQLLMPYARYTVLGA